MAYHCYFDFVPLLTNSNLDKMLWRAFLASARAVYAGSSLLVEENDYLEFQFGENLRLQSKCEGFLRFGSEFSGTQKDAPDLIVGFPLQHAQYAFGTRVMLWRGKDGGHDRRSGWSAVKNTSSDCDDRIGLLHLSASYLN